VAHAEASARTVDAAVTAAAAQLGLRSDQVDVEVLEEPVPSTFGYIGTPARVRVTRRATATASSGPASPVSGSSQGSGWPTQAASLDVTATPSPGSAGATAPGPAAAGAGRDSHGGPASGSERGSAGDPAASGSGGGSVGDPAAGSDVVLGQPDATAPDLAADPTASAIAAATPADLAGSSARAPAGSADAPSSGEPTTTPAPEGTMTPSPPDNSEATNLPNGSAPTSAPSSRAEPSGTSPPAASTPAGATPAATAASTAEAPTPTAASGAENGQDARPTTAPAGGATRGATRASRRTSRDRDEPIAPEMVEEDTERAGDFLEGLLDALDVDGDITTWVDEVGGHIDLEGADLEPLIGPNGETLDSLQELTRLAVLRRSKRRVRLLLDINGFRARQRDQLISIVRTTAEQVIKTREDHEFQPMSPAERKIVHDAVAAIDGVRTESWGEDPNRRVVIRPT
jgi:spoIIIJ-associated protein